MLKNIYSQITERVRVRVRYILDPDFREKKDEFSRLQQLPRRVSTTTSLLGPTTHLIDAASFLSAYRAIFETEIYAFNPVCKAPRIIDGGANVGLATLYWKKHFPQADIIAFEPDLEVFTILQKNIESHDCRNVSLISKGLWSHDGTLEFQSDGADAGHIAKVSRERSGTKSVGVTRLVPYLHERVDLLKLDIEGGEVEVLSDVAGHLGTVQNIFVEYHSYLSQEQRLDEVLRVLRQAGFRIHIQPELVASQPFLERKDSFGMDQRLNIFAYRE